MHPMLWKASLALLASGFAVCPLSTTSVIPCICLRFLPTTRCDAPASRGVFRSDNGICLQSPYCDYLMHAAALCSFLHCFVGNVTLRWNLPLPVTFMTRRYKADLCVKSDSKKMSLGSGKTSPTCMRCLAVEGDVNKRNDVVFCGSVSKVESNVIYFGGDVQDFSENMLAHRDNKKYEAWNLETTSKLLHARFPMSHIWVVRPSSMHLKTFSCYANFVDSSPIGIPDHSAGQKSWVHLLKLLQSAIKQVSMQRDANESSDLVVSPVADIPVVLVGFSKGCVVLNQLLYDLGEAKVDDVTRNFAHRMRHIHWLDGGHNGGANTWVTDEQVLSQLQGMDVRVSVHVTPYQVKDPMRSWIGKEEKKFVENMRKCGIDVMNTLHFANVERSLDCHFNVLKRF